MYSPVFDPSVPILKSQVEYYLSVENLCKDYYLRQHMDGQGFVHLATIAAFKRIKAVTEDVEMVRLACSLSDQIEFGVGDDGIERLRTRDKWQHFILPAAERAEPYRNDGPTNWTPYARLDAQFAAPFPGPMVPQQYPPTAAGAYPAFAEDQMYPPPFINGAAYDPSVNGGAVNGHHHGHDTRLSGGVPEYAPPQSPVTLESMTKFPDSQVENLMVILGYDEKDDAGSADAAGVAGYVSNDRQAANSSEAPR
jgi:la-related protein 1